MESWEQQAEEKKKSGRNKNVERQTSIERPKRISIPVVNGCLVPIAVFALMIVCVRECKRSGIRLEEEKIKLEQLKKQVQDGTLINDTTPIIIPDTLKLGKFEKAYIPLLKIYSERQKD